MKDNRSKVQLYSAAVKRLYMWNFRAKPLNLVLVTEFPKSGGSWFCQMLSEAANLPFPRNVSPKLEPCIMHGHHLFHPRMNKAVAVLRDGRDVMVSAYFHFLFENDRNPSQSVIKYRNKLNFEDYDAVIENMPRFIEYMFSGYAKKNIFHFSWSAFVDNIWRNSNRIIVIKYERLLQVPEECIADALNFYNIKHPDLSQLKDIIDRFSFHRMAKRRPGVENRRSFIRKGISGDWKNYFNEQSCEIFKKYAGDALIKAGYEKDLSWKNPNNLN